MQILCIFLICLLSNIPLKVSYLGHTVTLIKSARNSSSIFDSHKYLVSQFVPYVQIVLVIQTYEGSKIVLQLFKTILEFHSNSTNTYL